MSLRVPIKRLQDDHPTPTYAHVGDAGVDLCTSIDFTLSPFERMLIPCGIAIAIPEGYAGLVIPRSGLAINHGISVVNAPGLIDSNYRGEIKAILINLDPHESFHASKGDRIAQLVFVKVDEVHFESTLALPDSERGDNGFGSSGK